MPAQGHTAVSGQGSGARFPPRAASLPAVRVVCSEATSWAVLVSVCVCFLFRP